MRKTTISSLLLLPLGLALYMVPPAYLTGWRLSLYSFYLHAADRAGIERRPTSLPMDVQRELEDRLRQKDAEIAALRLRLEHLAEVREYLPTLRFQTASVIARHGGLHGDTMTLDRGRADGLHDGDAVIQGQALVGTIAQTGPHASLMRLLSNPTSYVVARAITAQEARRPAREDCSVEGLGLGEMRAVFYGTRVKARRGSAVLTSGLLGTMPSDLIIGELAEDPHQGTAPNTLEARIVLRARLIALEDVLVVHRAGTPIKPRREP